MTKRAPYFRPSTHGFRFANHFAVPLLAPALRLFSVSDGYGLCGGMAALAGDFFYHGRPVPAQKEAPATGSALHRALVRRQLDTFGAAPAFSTARRFAAWTTATDAAVRQHTLPEWQNARDLLARGTLVQLGLLYARRLTRLHQNHQVLACGHASPTAVRVYDPNRPLRDDVTIRLRPSRGDGQPGHVTWEQRAGSRIVRELRGFFVVPVARKPPRL